MLPVNKNKYISVIDKTFSIMEKDIIQGKFSPGDRMPGDRELAQMYSIGRSSMIKVLERLQAERYIERIPVYGTFVRSDLAKRQKLFSIAFVTPDAVLSPENIGINSWNGIMEIMQGMLEETSEHPGLQITLQHAIDSDDEDIIKQQFENISKFDGVIFCGCKMRKLKQQFAMTGKPALVVLPKINEFQEIFPGIYFNHLPAVADMAEHISNIAHSRKIILLYCKVALSETKEVINIVNDIFLRNNNKFENIYIDCIPHSEADIHAMLDSRFGSWDELKGTIIWCQNRGLLSVLNYLLNKNQINAELFGGPANISAGNIYPPVTYLKEPYSDIGKTAVSMLFDKLNNNKELTSTALELSKYHGTKPLTKTEEV